MWLEALEATQKLVLKSCGIQHAYLHLPLAAFEDSGYFCVLYAVMDKVGLFLTPARVGLLTCQAFPLDSAIVARSSLCDMAAHF